MSLFKIQKAGVPDIPLIRELTFKVWPQTYADILSPGQIEYMLDMMYSVPSLTKQIHEGAQFIIIYEGAEAVGFASYQETDPAVFKLHKIYVLPSQQGKGTGRFIIDHILDEIKKQEAIALQLQVNKYNKARYFYEKLGFSVAREFKVDIGQGYIMDDYLMEIKL
jgi:GNAT superfamily N-acetyltransferase